MHTRKCSSILFIGYWSFHDGLTKATVLPHLETLSAFPQIKKIVFVTIERKAQRLPCDLNIPKTIHEPIFSKNLPLNLVNKFYDFHIFPKRLIRLIKEHKIDTVICRGAPAGALGYLVWKKTNTPYYVESFEPHADYMVESGVWKSYDPRYMMQNRWERMQKKTASGLMPVAENFKRKLLQGGVDSRKIMVVPCSVDSLKFRFNPEAREKIRINAGIQPEHPVGIYVGKFGGIYYDRQAFALFREAFSHFQDFFLIILSPGEKEKIIRRLKEAGINDRYYIKNVHHHEIPGWLSAADFGFAPIKPANSRKYCSPIKTGEYWANGLPVLILDGIGDDSEIIKREGGGAILDWKDLKKCFCEIDKIISTPGHRNKISELARKYRSRNKIREAYQALLFSP